MADTYPVNWELDSLYPYPETDEFRRIVDDLKSRLTELADRSELPAISSSRDVTSSWSEFLNEYANAHEEHSSIVYFITCHAAADAANKVFQQYEAELSALTPLLSRIATNLEFALQAASDADFEVFVDADDDLRKIAFYLTISRKSAALRLPKEQELLAADLEVDGLHAWNRLYDRISGELRVQVVEDGKQVEKSPGQITFESPERNIRESNFHAADAAWSSISDTCADALNHIAGSRLSRYRRLGVDHLAVPLNMNRMSRETLDTMWSTISARKSCLVDYFKKKAELLGVEKLSWFDQQAPLPAQYGAAASVIEYDDACDLILEAFGEFSSSWRDLAQHAIDKQWIEVEDRPGKRQGGFCVPITSRGQSRIFMTFTNSFDGMSTLAHELGHAYHGWILRNENEFLREEPMNLAETASTFAEAVLGGNRLTSAESNFEKLELLDRMLGDAVAFMMNIHARFLFDDRFHRERSGGEVSVDRLSELMVEAQKEAYLDCLADDGWNPNFWISKLHFYISDWPFYNFPYTFGYLLSLGTYSLAKDSPDFPKQFDEFLLATGCSNAEDAVASAFGYDLRQPDFWNRSLDIVESRVQQFLQLADL